jgi:hypothetical protein
LSRGLFISTLVKFQQRYVKSHRNLTCCGSLASDSHGLNRVLVKLSLIDRWQRQMLYPSLCSSRWYGQSSIRRAPRPLACDLRTALSGPFNNRQAFVAFVIDDVDCDPGDLRRPRTGSGKCSAEIAKHLARLSSKIARANKLAMYGSAAAWEHVNLLGEYDLSEEKFKKSVGIKPPKLTD